MKTLPPGMQDHLDTGATTLCRCWQITRTDNVTYGFTDHDEDLTFSSIIFEAATGFTATAVESSLGLNVDNLDVIGALNSSRLNDDDLARGLYDNAAITIWYVNWQDVSQRIILRAGNLGEVSRGPTTFSAEVRGLAHNLNQVAGRVFQRVCDADLGDARCGVDLTSATYKGSGAVATPESNRAFAVTGLEGFANGWFSRGKLSWVSGANNGRAMEIKIHSPGRIELWLPMADTVAASDTFDVVAGCEKSFTICRQKFSNTVNFRGFPHMPGNDYVVSYPTSDSHNQGGSKRQESLQFGTLPGSGLPVNGSTTDTGIFSAIPDTTSGSSPTVSGDVPDTGSYGGASGVGGIGPDDTFKVAR
ncbi:DUF2163 domain-containing protein [bacterium AH-315-P15]|nr:DUF2163 domain-containing protein [bacterium AH-315-P15]